MEGHRQPIIPNEPDQEGKVRNMVAYHPGQCEDTDENILPVYFPFASPDYPQTCEDLGAT